MRGFALPLLAALLLHGLALALAAGRPGPRQAVPAAPADDTPALLRLSRSADLAEADPSAARTTGGTSAPQRPAPPVLPPPRHEARPAAPRAGRPDPERTRRPAPAAGAADAASRLRQLQAEAAGLARLWERAIPLPEGSGAAAGLPAALAGLPAAVERRRLPAAAARAAAATHGRTGAVPGGLLLVWHGGGGVWLLRLPLQTTATGRSGASAPGQGGGPRHEASERLGQVGGAEHPVAEPQHHPPGD